MSWRTNRFVVALRTVGRKVGFNRWLGSRLHGAGAGYEIQYNNALFNALRGGDCVWDVGANVGYYTRLFSEQVGANGQVFAFEPSPVNFKQLCTACTGLDNVTLLQAGLGREDYKGSLQQGADELGATSRIVEDASKGIVVDIRSGASLVRSGEVSLPNAVKIDVEGYELEVIEGLGEHLQQAGLRLIGVEVHFGILKRRGLGRAPRQIEKLLLRNGYSVSWPDSSHILAARST